jgi:hypothetical protein
MNLKAYWKKYYNHTELHRRYNYVNNASIRLEIQTFINHLQHKWGQFKIRRN